MYVGGTPYVDLASNRAGAGWAWNAATATLMLDSSYTGSNIQINCASTDTINLVYTGNVSIVGSSDIISALVCEGNLNINGSGGTLTVDYTADSDYCALEVSGKLTIQSGALDATSAGSIGSMETAVIYADNGVTITGSANVTATTTGDVSHGIFTSNNLTISTSGTVTAKGTGTMYALRVSTPAKLINISSGTVMLIQDDTPANLYFGTLNHTGGTLNGNPPPTGAPEVVDGSFPVNGTYQAGQHLDFAVTFDMPVTVNTEGGTPRFALTVGTQTRYASYVSGSGSLTFVFRYTVQPDDLDTDGITSTPLLDLNGGTIKSTGGVDAGLIAILPSFPSVLVNGSSSAATYTISGTMTGSDTKMGISNAILFLKNAGGAEIATTVTNALGQYSFSGLPAGEYTVRASADGYNIYTLTGTLTSATNGLGWDLELTKSGGVPVSTIAVIDVVEPVGGEQNDIRANVPNDAKYGLGGKDWFDAATGNYLTEGEKFVAGKQYLYEVRVILDAGYTLAPGFTATINGKAATVYDTSPSGSESNIYCAFTAKDASSGMLDAQTPNITGQPVGATYTQGAVAVPLSVTASVTDGGTLSYQWHGNSSPEKGGIIPGATGKTYTPSTSTVGTMYYLCIVTNTNNAVGGNKTATIYSDQISVTVQKGGSSDNGNGGGSGGGGYTPPLPQRRPHPKQSLISRRQERLLSQQRRVQTEQQTQRFPTKPLPRHKPMQKHRAMPQAVYLWS